MFAFFRGIRLDQENLRMNGVGGGFSRFGVEGHQAKQKEKIHKCGWCCRQAPVDAPSCPCGWWVLSHARLAAGSVLCGWNSPYAAITGWSRVWDRGRAGEWMPSPTTCFPTTIFLGLQTSFPFCIQFPWSWGTAPKTGPQGV